MHTDYTDYTDLHRLKSFINRYKELLIKNGAKLLNFLLLREYLLSLQKDFFFTKTLNYEKRGRRVEIFSSEIEMRTYKKSVLEYRDVQDSILLAREEALEVAYFLFHNFLFLKSIATISWSEISITFKDIFFSRNS